jgi:3-deoxy-7-phosphoheptulonate synthase
MSWPDFTSFYRDDSSLITQRLRAAPCLATEASIARLQQGLDRVATDPARWIVQFGECAESYEILPLAYAEGYGRLIEELSVSYPGALALLRLAGQWTKPRSASREVFYGQVFPSYRGDGVHEADPWRRHPGSFTRLFQGYEQAAKLRQALPSVSFSHEALHGTYEVALTRPCETETFHGRNFASSAESVWLGHRSLLGGASSLTSWAGGLINPVGLKLGPGSDPEVICGLLQSWQRAEDSPWRCMAILRFGLAHRDSLERMVAYLAAHAPPMLWLCDPMHGNGWVDSQGMKRRDCGTMAEEIECTRDNLRRHGQRLHGIHLEVAPFAVQECLDPGENPLLLSARHYRSLCDPRLSPMQASRLLATIHPWT